MQDPQNYTPSELIDLFIDSEADSTQQAVLFAALANDEALQSEFAEAMRIRAAIEQDRAEVQTPIPVAQSLFTRAGMVAPASILAGGAAGSAASMAAVQSLASPATAESSSGAAAAPRRWPMAMVGGMLLGAMLMFLWLDYGPGGDGVSQPGLASAEGRHSLGADDPQGYLADSLNSLHGALHSAQVQFEQLESDNRELQRQISDMQNQGRPATLDTQNSDPSDNSRTVQSEAARLKREADLLADIRELQQALAQAQKLQAAGSNTTADAANSTHESNTNAKQRGDVLLADFRRPGRTLYARISAQELLAASRNMPNSAVVPSPQWAGAELDANWLDGVSLHVRGLENLEWYPLRSIGRETNGPWFNNISLAILLNLDENWSVGLEGGQETFPLFVADQSQTGFSLEPRQWWLGATAQLRVPLEFMPIEVDLLTQLGAAGSRTGPLGRLYTALSWKASERVSLDLGIDGSMLFYQLDGQIYTASKVGAAYGISIKF